MSQPIQLLDESPAELESHPLYRRFMAGERIGYDSPLGFSCTGCGLCCVDTEVLVTPPEAARIIWFLKRNPALEAALRDRNIQWGARFLGGSTGLPVLQLNFTPFDAGEPDKGRHCPFLVPVYGGTPANPYWLKMAWCGIRSARPGACRAYPLGRILVGDGDPNRPQNWQYRIVARCPGFEPAGPGDAVPPGYTPPDPAQTVRDWLTQQLDPEQEAERTLYLHDVITAFMQAHLHVPTQDSPGGYLSNDFAIFLGTDLLYNPPPPPSDPAQDHQAIMAWLRTIRDMVPAIGQAWRQVRETEVESDSKQAIRSP